MTGVRETIRAELAGLLEVPPETLADRVSLRENLALDSITMMRVVTWLESRGTAVDSRPPDTVGELLSLVECTPAAPKIRIRGLPGVPERFAAEPPVDPLVPALETSSLRLAPIAPDDLGFLYLLAVGPETGFRWRYRGSIPPFERFQAELWNQVLLQFVARHRQDDAPVGHVVAYGDELSLRHTYIGAVFQTRWAGTGLAAQAVSLFARHLFRTFPLNKIYMEVPGFNWPQIQSGQGSLFHVERVLRDHDYYAGRYWDKHICALYPDDVNLTQAQEP
jgi:RimJ/RimL family protein N-acetyltransferase/aryl carrier-like protein